MNELKPVAYRHRWFDANPNTVTFGQWYPWEYCNENKYNEIRGYIADGYKYEAEQLYSIPDTHRVVSVEFLERLSEETIYYAHKTKLQAIIDNKGAT